MQHGEVLPQYDFRGRVALVTGGGSGIGAATARTLGRSGARVVVADRTESTAKSVAAEIEAAGGVATPVVVDVSDPVQVDAAVSAAVNSYGRLDIGVNNAGVGGDPPAPTADCSLEDWRRIVAVNLDGVFYCMRAEIPELLKAGGGAIVNTSSICGLVATPDISPYTASKHGVIGLSKNAAVEYGQAGIRVNAIGPGYTMTPILEPWLPDAAAVEAAGNMCALKRCADPQEIANLIVWLVSDAASFVTASFYPVDGGFLAT